MQSLKLEDLAHPVPNGFDGIYLAGVCACAHLHLPPYGVEGKAGRGCQQP